MCDRCGRALLVDHAVRYVAEIQVYAAYDPLEVTREDLERSGDPALWDRLLEQLNERSAEELEAEVFKRMRFDLCPPCHKAFLAQPLPPPGESGPRVGDGIEPAGEASDAA